MNEEITLDVQDVINTLTNQRNAALDEIVKMSAMIRSLQKKLEVPLGETVE